jgi:excisionase family DNA binding protein
MPHPVIDGKSDQAETQAFSGGYREKTSVSLPLLLTPAGAARELSLSRYTVYSNLKSGRLRGRRYGRLILIPRAELERFASSLEQK